MEVLTEHELNIRKDEIVERILSGEILFAVFDIEGLLRNRGFSGNKIF